MCFLICLGVYDHLPGFRNRHIEKAHLEPTTTCTEKTILNLPGVIPDFESNASGSDNYQLLRLN